ncbi:hypothetical protein [Agrobacterium tumefaciens]|uniref:hypothetical protein n=1 Tax=Agrobacterium tumefaciens TaxID=358 RepID=UPI0021CF6154|nr:hypothetical protein [Agrobacterium tumefaciens]UXS45886.1 hypothetical protein FY149_01060 [Agrobacterium tumefaciens]
MAPVDIISLAGNNPGKSYYRIVIAGAVYSDAFPTVKEMQRYFRVEKPQHLKGFPFPGNVFETRVDVVVGDNKVIAVLGAEDDVRYYVVGGPSGHMSEQTFTDFKKAVDFASSQST